MYSLRKTPRNVSIIGANNVETADAFGGAAQHTDRSVSTNESCSYQLSITCKDETSPRVRIRYILQLVWGVALFDVFPKVAIGLAFQFAELFAFVVVVYQVDQNNSVFSDLTRERSDGGEID